MWSVALGMMMTALLLSKVFRALFPAFLGVWECSFNIVHTSIA